MCLLSSDWSKKTQLLDPWSTPPPSPLLHHLLCCAHTAVPPSLAMSRTKEHTAPFPLRPLCRFHLAVAPLPSRRRPQAAAPFSLRPLAALPGPCRGGRTAAPLLPPSRQARRHRTEQLDLGAAWSPCGDCRLGFPCPVVEAALQRPRSLPAVKLDATARSGST